MNRTVALVMLAHYDADARPFRNVIESAADLGEHVDLRFAGRDAVSDAIGDVEVVACGGFPSDLLEKATQLRWISFWSAGLDNKVSPDMLKRGLMLTSSNGIHGPNIAEHVLMFMLMFVRQMPFHFRMQREGRWERKPWGQWSEGGGELDGQTLGIVGLGRIGEALTQRARACGMRVIAVKRNPQARYDAAVMPDALYGPEELPRLLEESDHVCIAAPYTPDTHRLIDATMLARMRPSAYLYNIARGKIIDEAALIDALRNGRLAGAGLDVFETEPLPADSPLWTLENVLVTPHVSGITPHYFTRAADIFAQNLRRYLNAEPLLNLYNPQRGY
jgi:phosphoglycerate dehydrogenase-like enzyme